MEIFNTIDLATVGLAGLVVVGVVNIVTQYNPTISSKTKFLISIMVAIIVGFIPANLGNEILTRLKDAIAIAFAASGTYKIASKAGGE